MSDIELLIHDAFEEAFDGIEPAIASRLSARSYRVDPPHTKLFAAIGAAATTIGAAIAIAVVLLTSGASVAFAGWTSTPTLPSSKALTSARAACGGVPATRLLASEARGPYTAITFLRKSNPWQCVVKNARVVVDVSTFYPTRLYASVPSGKVMLPTVTQRVFGNLPKRINSLEAGRSGNESQNRSNALLADIRAIMTGPGSLSVMIGAAGADVTAVTFVLADGEKVHATVEHGWYVAWWPGASKPGGAQAVRVAVTTVAGTRASRMPPLLEEGIVHRQECAPGDGCSVFVPLSLAAAVAPSVLKHFAVFGDTTQAKPSVEARAVRLIVERMNDHGVQGGGFDGIGLGLGLDGARARSLTLGPHATLWLIPGSEQICSFDEQGGADRGSCGPVSSLLRYGAFMGTGGIEVHHKLIYRLGGFVPNGNTSVTIKMSYGQARAIPVRHNTFVASLRTEPVSVIFKDAGGKTVTVSAPDANVG